MAEEKIVTLNFRKFLKSSSRTKRKKRAIHYLRSFLQKKSGKVKIDVKLNRQIWSRSATGTLGVIRIRLRKKDDGSLVAEAVD